MEVIHGSVGISRKKSRGTIVQDLVSYAQAQNISGDWTDDERLLIEALREIDPIRRRGVIITALDQLNASLQDQEIKRNRNKKKLIQDAIKDLSKAMFS